jgi:hypothetical protein
LGISINPVSSNNVIDNIWNQIQKKKQPVVIVINATKVPLVRRIRTSVSNTPSPHYNVIAGCKRVDGVRQFYVLDPYRDYGPAWYTEVKLLSLLRISLNSPYATQWAWLNTYAQYIGINDPCYIGFVFE